MDAITLGELLIDLVCPEPDRSLSEAGSFTKAPGGAPANVAVGLQRLGLATGFIGCVGRDPFGDYLAGVLAAEGVDTRHLIRAAARTTLAFVATRADGRKDITFWRNPGADAELRPEDLDPTYLATTRLFHFCSVSLSRSPAREATLAAARLAKQAGALISFDPNWRAPLWDRPGEAAPLLQEGLALADVVKVADEEMELVCGTANEDEALSRLLARGPRVAVVTRGAAGSVARTATARAEAPGFAVKAIDPLGAGDAFVAALLYRLLDTGHLAPDTAQLGDILRFANAAGALATTRVGVIPALPDQAAIAALVSQGA